MIPVTPSAIHAPWRRSTRPTASGVLTSLTTTMPSIASVASRSTSRHGCSTPAISVPSAVTTAIATSTARIVSVLWKASQPVVPSSVVNSRASREKKLLDRALDVADARLLRGLHRGVGVPRPAERREQADRGGDDEEDVGAEADGAHGRWLLIGSASVRLNTSAGRIRVLT